MVLAQLQQLSVLQVLTTVAVLGLTTFLLLWRRTARWFKQTKALTIWVERVPGARARKGPQSGTEADVGGLLHYLELDPAVTSTVSCLSGMKLLSLGDYFASLVPHGAVSWERVLVSIADRYGLTAALPLALFLPNSWRSEKGAGGLLASFPMLAASTFLSTTLSTLDLVAFGQTVHIYTREQRQRQAAAAAAASTAGGIGGAELSTAERVADAQLAPALGPLDYLRLGGRPRSGTGETSNAEGSKGDSGSKSGAGSSKGGGGSGADKPAASSGPTQAPLPNPMLLTKENILAVAGLSPHRAADPSLLPAPTPKPLSPLLPDLCLGNGGLMLTHSAAGAVHCEVMAKVANRLTANALAGLPPGLLALGRGSSGDAGQQVQQTQQERFTVQLVEGGPLIDSMEGLLCVLREAGHTVDLWVSSNLTSLGMGLSVRDGEGAWQQIPLAYPLRCSGLWARDAEGRQQDIVTLMPHAAINLRVRGPVLDFELEWCLSIEGFTGWLPLVFVNRAWASGEPFRVTHPLLFDGSPHAGSASNSGGVPVTGVTGSQGTADAGSKCASECSGGPIVGSLPLQQQRAVRLLTAASCVLNLAAQRDRLLFGGYGFLGVCIDSVAALQQTILGRCTLFPLILGGEAKLGLMALYREASAAGAKGGLEAAAGAPQSGCATASSWEYSAEAAALQQALAELPYDAVQEPRTAAAACRRALACLPEPGASPFVVVRRCQELLQAALAAATELYPGPAE